jgi:hypothetical protein
VAVVADPLICAEERPFPFRAEYALMRPISARFSVVAQFVIPRQARLILHNKDRARKRFVATALPGPSAARQTRASSKSDSDEKRN